jgi:hypothetical protein
VLILVSMALGSVGEASWLGGDLENDTAIIYVLDRDLRIVYCNEAWDRFATENGGRSLLRPRPLGLCVIDVIPPQLKRFFEKAYREALSTGLVWQHCYECSSPAVYRKYEMKVHPDREAGHLVVVNSLAVEWLHSATERETYGPDEEIYTDWDGIVTVCCECRRTRRSGREASIWDWVPGYVEQPPGRISHGICDVCLQMSYS